MFDNHLIDREVFKYLIINLCFMFTVAWIFTFSRLTDYLIGRIKYTKIYYIIYFSIISFLGVLLGYNYGPGIVSLRLIGPMLGGILFGPAVGLGTGVISGLFRLTQRTEISLYTSVATVVIGLVAGMFHILFKGKINRINGTFAVLIIEIIYDILSYFILGKEIWHNFFSVMFIHRSVVDIAATLVFLRMLEVSAVYKEELTKFKILSSQDYITGIFNIRHFEDTLTRLINKAGKEGRHLGLILLSIENIEIIISKKGFDNGKMIISQAGKILHNICGGNLLFKLPQNVFAIVLLHELYNLEEKKTSIKEILMNSIKEINEEIDILCSVALFPRDGVTMKEFLQHAEKGLELEKQQRLLNRRIKYEREKDQTDSLTCKAE